MEQFKRAQVVMLPHNNINTVITLYKTASGKPLNLSTNTAILSHHTNQHLYIISDDEIKEGDWSYNIVSKTIFQVDSQFIKLINQNEIITNKKIIATTDSSLEVLNYHPEITLDTYKRTLLPQPSQQFIEKYIECYNKGEVIIDVLVEYEKCSCQFQHEPETCERLKINPKDNTITIEKVKNSWNREEVITLINNYTSYHGLTVNKWIEENL